MLDKIYLELTDFQLDTLVKGLNLASGLSAKDVSFTAEVMRLIRFAYVGKERAIDYDDVTDILHPYWEKVAKEFAKEVLKREQIPEGAFNEFLEWGDWWYKEANGLWQKVWQENYALRKYGYPLSKDENGRRKYKIELGENSEDKLRVFPLLLEMVVRVSLGQLDALWMVNNGIIDIKTGKRWAGLYSITSEEMAPYRERMFKIFPYGGNSSLGIGSPELSERVRTLCEIYKAFQYQYNCYGVVAYGPIKLSHTDDPLPIIGFEEQLICDYTDDEKILEKAYKEGINDDYKILRTPIVDDGTLYFPVENLSCATYQRMIKGQKLYRKVNGYYDIR